MTIALKGGFIVVIGYRITVFIADRMSLSDDQIKLRSGDKV